MMQDITILGDCLVEMDKIRDGSVDMVMTSPPYDNLRSYNNTLEWGEHVWKPVIKQLYRVVKDGGVVVWVVGDATIKGSETGTSFRQALYFMEVGFNLHDTMIYRKYNFTPLTHNRYEQEWEYMFCFSKGKPKAFNPIKEPCKLAGQKTWGSPTMYKDNSGNLTRVGQYTISDTKIKGNIFTYQVGSTQTGGINHPAQFPLQLATDHILSWSNPNDTILDPFAGSFTTAIACLNTSRHYICIEKDEGYYALGNQRIQDHLAKLQADKLPLFEEV